ncbi:serine hydrolase [Allorhizocola rhizosphaerae]|uniref:serine hydrolase n=1 Tax=Allorhizocola rhizosphaerae TaxID=1872709 RepID=UPI000E3D006E|nr:serine hydrolase [Allorhizocola rhizosphaerae]
MTPELDTFPGTASVWFGPLSGPARFATREHERHYAASTMKVGVMVAAWRAIGDLDRPVFVHNEHPSVAPGNVVFGNDPDDDGDEEVWTRLGERVPLRWLIERMIVRSSNLATNLVLGELGWDFDAVNQVWRDAGAKHAHTDRGIEDTAGREAGFNNEVTAADLGALMGALAIGQLADQRATADMLDILCAQQWRDDLLAGLPAGTRAAVKNGWITGVRHSAAAIFPQDAPPYVLAVCTTGRLADEQACALLSRVAQASWVQRI